MTRQARDFVGAWRIVQMELWDRDYIDLEGPAHITFDPGRLGSFRFRAVEGGLDYRVSSEGGVAKAEFSWDGFNGADPSCGRGWVVLDDARLVGRLYFHNGDDSGFVAERATPPRRIAR